MKRGIADISVPLFKVACGFISKDRPNLNGVRIERHPKRGVVLVATDGHRLIALHDVNGYCRKPMTLDAKEGLKAARKDDKRIKNQETRWRIASDKPAKGSKRVRLPDDQKYPEWMNLIRKLPKRGGVPTTFNPRYVASFAAAAQALDSSSRYPEIQIVPAADNASPMVVLFPKVPHALGVIMPMLSRSAGALPGFISHMLTAQKVRAAKPRRKK